MIEGITLGAPGVYQAPATPLFALTGERMDVCAFVGVAPRGPARLPIFDPQWRVDPDAPGSGVDAAAAGFDGIPSLPLRIESWSEYRRRFGGFEGPGLLPYAVATFFENGGRTAYVIRTVAAVGPAGDGVARAEVPGLTAAGVAVGLRARDEGAWGNSLRVRLAARPRPVVIELDAAAPGQLRVAADGVVVAGSSLRVDLGAGVRLLRQVTAALTAWDPATGQTSRIAILDTPLPATTVAPTAERIELELTVEDGEGRVERFDGLGLSPEHPRWLARVLVEGSRLLLPDERPGRRWDEQALSLPLALPALGAATFSGGADRYAAITPEDHFDPAWTPGREVARGVMAVADLADVSLLVVPDLYAPAQREEVPPPRPGGPARFEVCLAPTVAAPPPPAPLTGLELDPELPADREAIIGLQRRLVDLADGQQAFVVLLDVPQRLSQRQTLAWRARFGSCYAAAYQPWLKVARPDDARDSLRLVNPAAVAAGLIARQELRFGVQHGPANAYAAGVVLTDEDVSPARHDELHQANVNVFLRERAGIRLTAGRTLSRQLDYRQLSVRRLVTMLRRALERQMQWAVFEPNNARLQGSLRQALRAFLRQLFLADAFAGAREEDAFFVRCDASNNPPSWQDAGRLLAEVGVAPAEPLEFIVLRLTRDGDGTVRVEG
jgi:uncharacterized protein